MILILNNGIIFYINATEIKHFKNLNNILFNFEIIF